MGNKSTDNISLNEMTKEKQYWEENLLSIPVKTKFPYDFVKGYNSGEVSKKQITSKLSAEAVLVLEKLSNGSMYKLHMLLTASVNILLYKYTGNEDIIIGSPIYKQDKEGEFLNTLLPLRCSVKGDMTFRELLMNARDTILKAYENQNYPIRKLVNKLDIPSGGKGFPLLDVMLVLSNIHDKKYVEDIGNNLTFVFCADGKGISATAEYNSDFYEESNIHRILQSLDCIFRAISDDINIKIKDINILTSQQYESIFNGFNAYKELDIEEKPLYRLFEEQAVKTPKNIAVSVGNTQITYEELNRKSNQLAHYLQDAGLQYNDIIGIMLEPSIELCIGLMGILKAGGAYLPLDPNYPKDRLEFMIKDSGLRFAVTDEKFFSMFSEDVNVIDVKLQEIFTRDAGNLNKIQSVEDLAYIIFTSGSTGKPKGVMIEHRTASKTILWRKDEYGFNPAHSVLQLVSYSFDGFVGGFFAPIISGCKVTLLNNDEVKNLSIIKKYIKEKNITHLHGVPSLIGTIMESISDGEARSLKVITVGGDKVAPNLIKTCSVRNIELVNEYGPTENTVISTIFRNMADHSSIRIGKPVYDTKIYILDKDDNLCPVGVTGELCVSGGRLARGYLNRPELTSEKFVCSPFEKGQIMYRTGDLARWCEDGNIDFVGRKDYQVKIRGFRIELEEIEARLSEYSWVKQAAVIDREYENSVKYLCAYFVSDKKITVNELVDYLSEKLPEYMIPSYFMQIPQMPLTSNGKIDRKALPLMEGKANTGAEFVAPRNDIESKIAEIWEDVLGIKGIGVYDNFFRIGGDSLKAIRAASILSEKFNTSINDIYKFQSIEQLASQIEYSDEDLITRIQRFKEEIAAAGENNTAGESNDCNTDELEEQYASYRRKIERYREADLEKTQQYKDILLTGATGYVGVYLLREILCCLDSTVHLLVRGKDINEAERRVARSLSFYFGEDFYKKYLGRIKILNGSISDTYLGLEKRSYEELSMQIDCIINSAAYVKHYGNYEDFYNINVQGTKKLIEFARNGKLKDFNQISTTTISDGNIDNVKIALFTEFETDIGQKSSSYYSQTKLTGDKVVMEASESLLNVKIFRLGNVTFNYETGAFQENIEDNAFYKILKSYIKLNNFPRLEEKILNFSYVDQIAKSIILLFNRSELKNEVFHIYNPDMVSTSELAGFLKKRYNGLEVKCFSEFLDFILKNIHNEDLRSYIDNILMNLVMGDSESVTQIIGSNEKTGYILDRLGFKWSELDSTAVNKMMQYCERVGFL